MRLEKKEERLKRRLSWMLLFLIIVLTTGCVASSQPSAPPLPPANNTQVNMRDLPYPNGKRALVAIAGFENKSTYSADRLWDTSSRLLASSLIQANYFRVVEWEKMKQLFDWDTLSNASLVKSPDDLKRAQRILLCEYFVTGTITFFNIKQHAQVSAMSKSKVLDTTVRVDLLLQDARTGEYLSASSGEHTVRQSYTAGMSGGQTGSWDSHSGDEALSQAINIALYNLVLNFHSRHRG